MGEHINWENEFQKLGLEDNNISLSRASSGNGYFQHRLPQPDDKNYPSFDPTVTLRYRDSLSSNASSLSRNSTISSTDTRYFSTMGSPSAPQSPTLNGWHHYHHPNPLPSSPLAPTTTATTATTTIPRPPLPSYSHQSIPLDPQPTLSIIEPTGCFVPIKSLPFIQKNEITKNHYVVPSFAMAGESQAEVMSLLFNQKDTAAFKPKEEYERTVPWHIDGNSSLVTLFQHTSLGQENPVTRNYLVGLGQRLGITSILIIVSIETIGTVYPLLDNLVNSMALDTNPSNSQQVQPTWWNRVILIINQQHSVNEQTTIDQRKSILSDEMPRIQARYRLSTPLSLLFLSTTLYCQLKPYPTQQQHYKSCSQRILWQMMEKHMLSGRWSSELISSQSSTRQTTTSLINILNEDDESSSSSDDAIFKTVIVFENGKKKKMSKKTKNISIDNHIPLPSTPLQRRATRRQVQKLHSHDGDNGTSLPRSSRYS